MEITLSIFSFTIAFVLSIIAIPPIIRVAKAKRLFDSFNERKIHDKIVPPLGGVAIFIAFTISTIISLYGTSGTRLRYLLAATILMFFIGLKDDLIDISARKKLGVQIFAALILVVLGHFRFTSLHGIMGIYEINYFSGVILSVFAIVVITNAFNLIDGVDGLASGLGMTSSTLLGIWFLLAGQMLFAILAFALVGSLAGFFIFNVFGEKYKLFMGDTGSLIVGIVIATLIIEFNELNITATTGVQVVAAPAVSFAIIIVPLFDTIRVMTIRMIQKRSPFSADKNHIHHRIFYFFKKHIVVTSIVLGMNLGIFLFALWINRSGLSVNYQLMMILMVSIVVFYIPSVIIRISEMKKSDDAKQSKRELFFRMFF